MPERRRRSRISGRKGGELRASRNGNGRHPEGPERTLVIIGGGEDRTDDKVVLQEVARRVGPGKLVVTTVASRQPEGYFETYDTAFRDLGVGEVVDLELRDRCAALSADRARLLDGADGVFFTGGDQLKITSQMGDTPIDWRLREIYEAGGVVAGTSAGASAMCETMLVRGSGQESHRIGDIKMAPGLGFIQDVVIDQHFAQRGRMGRLLGVVAENPRVLGIGIDEDTAIVVRNEESFYVVGSGAVYVVDGSGVTHSNIADEQAEQVLSIYDVRLHVLSAGDCFDLNARRPAEVPRPAPAPEQREPAEREPAAVES